MKLIVFLALALAMMACLIKAQSVTEVALDAVPHSRQKRARCDSTGCAIHCALSGKRGGLCILGYCNCR